MDWDWDKVEILKTPENQFDWLKLIFSMKESIRDHFCKVSSDFKSFWQVTIFHPTYLPKYQIMDWDRDKVEILKTPKNEFDWLKMIFFMKESIRDHFCKVSSDFKIFWQFTIFNFTTGQFWSKNIDNKWHSGSKRRPCLCHSFCWHFHHSRIVIGPELKLSTNALIGCRYWSLFNRVYILPYGTLTRHLDFYFIVSESTYTFLAALRGYYTTNLEI